MKIAKHVLLALVAVVIVILVLAANDTSEFEVER